MNYENRSPYNGILISILFMCLPSILCTWLFFEAIDIFQPQFGHDLNWASAKVLGCGIGVLFHLGCLLKGDFTKEFSVVINRLKEFFSYLFISPSLAFRFYFDDIKENGVVFWIYFVITFTNTYIFVTAIQDVIALLAK